MTRNAFLSSHSYRTFIFFYFNIMSSTKLVAWNPSSYDVFAVGGSRLELWKVTEDGDQRTSKAISTSSLASNVSCMDWQSIEEDSLLAHGSTSGKIGLVRWQAEGNSEVHAYNSTTLHLMQYNFYSSLLPI
ncbi:hypothetical protein EON64_20675 [archaeon]|nr:MAG: hypothetical protein EON64_20675 [archaeon]